MTKSPFWLFALRRFGLLLLESFVGVPLAIILLPILWLTLSVIDWLFRLRLEWEKL